MRVVQAFITMIGIFFTMPNACGYVYEIKIGRLQIEPNKYQYIIGFCDLHDKNHAANPAQRKSIEHHLLSYNPRKIHVAVEDLSSPSENGTIGCGSYYINSKTGILAGLSMFCKQRHIPVCNVEYRYCRVVSLGPVINNINADPHLFSSTKKLTVAQLLQEIERTCQELVLSTHDARFKALVLEKAAQVNNHQKKLNLIKDSDQTIADYLKDNCTPLNRIEMVKQLLTFDGIFVGLKMAHCALQAKDKEKIMLFGGGTHVNEAFEILQKMGGFSLVSKNTATPLGAPALARCVGAQIIDVGLCVKPEPISLEVLEHYLKN